MLGHIEQLEDRRLMSVSFSLVQAPSGEPIRAINDGDAIIQTQNVNIIANPTGNVKSVYFVLDGKSHLENYAAWSVFGDWDGVYGSWDPTLGQHSLSVTTYSGQNRSGSIIDRDSVEFTIVSKPPPSPDVDTVYINPGADFDAMLRANNRANVTFIVAPGTYTVDSQFAFTKAGVSIVGPANRSAVLQYGGTGSAFIVTGSADNFSFRNFTLNSTLTTTNSTNPYFFHLLDDKSGPALFKNLQVNLAGLAISFGADDVTIEDVDFGVLRGYGVYTDRYGGVRNERWVLRNVTSKGTWYMHVLRFNNQDYTLIENCELHADTVYGKNGWQGEPLKWVSGHDNIIRDSQFYGPRIVFGPHSTTSGTLDNMYVLRTRLPWVNLYSGATDVRFEACTITSGDAKPDQGYGYAEAGFVDCTFTKGKIVPSIYGRDWYLVNISYENSTVNGVDIEDIGNIPDPVVL